MSELLLVAADLAPAVGDDAPSAFFGDRWFLSLDAGTPGGLAALRFAAGAACFEIPEEEDQSPFDRWCRQSPAPSVAERARLRALARAPWGGWRLAALPDAGARAVLAGADGERTVLGWEPACLPPDRAPRPGDLVIARLVPWGAGWAAPLALVLPPVCFGALAGPGPGAGPGAGPWIRRAVRAAGVSGSEDPAARTGRAPAP